MTHSIDYPKLIDQAMRDVVRGLLRDVQKAGLPGEHHFYISFQTDFPGVKISETLRAKYPEEMTIVLQHQFWDFKVEDTLFQVTLSFSGVPEKLVIPFAALTGFADPSMKFGLQFHQLELEEDMLALDGQDNLSLPLTTKPVSDDDADGSAEIISLDMFRKK